jgi:hypothetical protein
MDLFNPTSFESPKEDFFRGLNMSELNIDEAFLNVTSYHQSGIQT